MSFDSQLWLLIADKLAIGLIILFLGFWINKKLERFRVELGRASKEHEIRFSRLHEKRAEVLSELYFFLFEARSRLGALDLGVRENEDGDDLLERVAERATESSASALKILQKNRLLLSKDLADSIHSILSVMEVTSQSYPYEKIRSGALDRWTERRPSIDKVLSDLENEFRVMLGSEIKNTWPRSLK